MIVMVMLVIAVMTMMIMHCADNRISSTIIVTAPHAASRGCQQGLRRARSFRTSAA